MNLYALPLHYKFSSNSFCEIALLRLFMKFSLLKSNVNFQLNNQLYYKVPTAIIQICSFTQLCTLLQIKVTILHKCDMYLLARQPNLERMVRNKPINDGQYSAKEKADKKVTNFHFIFSAHKVINNSIYKLYTNDNKLSHKLKQTTKLLDHENSYGR